MPTAILAAASATVTSGLLCPTPSTRFSASTSGLRHCPHATDPRLSFRENHGTLSCSSASHQTSDTLPCSVSADPPSAQRLTPRRPPPYPIELPRRTRGRLWPTRPRRRRPAPPEAPSSVPATTPAG